MVGWFSPWDSNSNMGYNYNRHTDTLEITVPRYKEPIIIGSGTKIDLPGLDNNDVVAYVDGLEEIIEFEKGHLYFDFDELEELIRDGDAVVVKNEELKNKEISSFPKIEPLISKNIF